MARAHPMSALELSAPGQATGPRRTASYHRRHGARASACWSRSPGSRPLSPSPSQTPQHPVATSRGPDRSQWRVRAGIAAPTRGHHYTGFPALHHTNSRVRRRVAACQADLPYPARGPAPRRTRPSAQYSGPEESDQPAKAWAPRARRADAEILVVFPGGVTLPIGVQNERGGRFLPGSCTQRGPRGATGSSSTTKGRWSMPWIPCCQRTRASATRQWALR